MQPSYLGTRVSSLLSFSAWLNERQNAVFDACIVLLLNVWGGRQVGLAVDPQKCLQDVEMCLRIFRIYESR
jgi:hypothetical protein